MADNLYFIESIYTPTDSTKSVVSLLSARENEQTVIVRNLEEQQLKMYNHMGTIREGWYVYYDEGKQVPFGYGNLSHYAREQFREYYVLRNQLVGRLIDADSEAAIVPSYFQGKKTKVTSYHINVGHGNCSIVLIEAGSFYQIWMVDCSIIDKTDKEISEYLNKGYRFALRNNIPIEEKDLFQSYQLIPNSKLFILL